MAFVIDASIALAWCFEDEASPMADRVLSRLEDEGEWRRRSGLSRSRLACGPQGAEAALTSERSGDGSTPDHASGRGRADQSRPGLGDVLFLARAAGLSTYDAAYLDLALRRGLPLATADEYLSQAAQASGVDLVG